MTSSGNQSFVDRALVSNEYARGRDTGVAVQGVLFRNKLEYRAGIFNGNGLTRSANDNASLQMNARVMWQPNGNQNLLQRGWVGGALYSEADFESTTVPLYAVAVNYEHNDFHHTSGGNDLKSDVVGLDGVFKYKGIFATGEYFVRRRTPEAGPRFNADGGFGQVGVMLNGPRTWEAVFRYGSRDVNDTIADNAVSEVRGGVNYYYRRHLLKFQVDAGQVETGAGPGLPTRQDFEVRAQTQFVF
jgi:phosphate-selective porin